MQHLVPTVVDDHELSLKCWCRPVVDRRYPGGGIALHVDGRFAECHVHWRNKSGLSRRPTWLLSKTVYIEPERVRPRAPARNVPAPERRPT